MPFVANWLLEFLGSTNLNKDDPSISFLASDSPSQSHTKRNGLLRPSVEIARMYWVCCYFPDLSSRLSIILMPSMPSNSKYRANIFRLCPSVNSTSFSPENFNSCNPSSSVTKPSLSNARASFCDVFLTFFALVRLQQNTMSWLGLERLLWENEWPL